MIYKKVFNLLGTEEQQALVRKALDAIKFPFERLKFPNGTTNIGWTNLNSAFATDALASQEEHINDDDEFIEGVLEGRRYTMGVFYPSSGSVYIDNDLINYPQEAKTTISAEIAHAVDEFLPLTDTQRKDIMTLVHGGDSTEHGHSWWEKVDYGTEYYGLVAESFMILFTYAYSDMPFDGATDFLHAGSPDMGDDIRKILNIERTDYIIPTPAVEPVPTQGSGWQPSTDTSGSSSGNTGDTGVDTFYVVYGKSKIYHLPTHYKNKNNVVPLKSTEGKRICKICEKKI